MAESDKKHVFDNPRNVKLVVCGLFAICGLSVVAEFFVHRHMDHPWESLFNFYSIYGFVACVMLVLIAKMLRYFIMRKENYYDD